MINLNNVIHWISSNWQKILLLLGFILLFTYQCGNTLAIQHSLNALKENYNTEKAEWNAEKKTLITRVEDANKKIAKLQFDIETNELIIKDRQIVIDTIKVKTKKELAESNYSREQVIAEYGELEKKFTLCSEQVVTQNAIIADQKLQLNLKDEVITALNIRIAATENMVTKCENLNKELNYQIKHLNRKDTVTTILVKVGIAGLGYAAGKLL